MEVAGDAIAGLDVPFSNGIFENGSGACVSGDCDEGEDEDGFGKRPMVSIDQLVALRTPHPPIPSAALGELGPGDHRCRVRLDVDERGRVSAVTLLSCPEVMHATTQKTLLRWRFKPFSLDGQPRPSATVANITYRLGAAPTTP